MRHPISSIEPLEPRIAPAVLVTVGDFDGDGIEHDLIIKGGAGKERVTITDATTTTRLFIDANGDGDFTDPADTDNQLFNFPVQQFEINMGGGADIVTVNQTGNYNTPKSFLVNLGSGNNEFHFIASNATTINPNGITRFDITGGAQNDYLDMHFESVVGLLSITTHLGGGTDGQLSAGKIVGPSKIEVDAIVFGGHIDADLDLGTGSNRFLLDLTNSTYGGFNVPTAANFRIIGSNVATQKDDVTIDLGVASLDTGGKVRIAALLGGGNDTLRALISGDLALQNSQAANEDGAILSLDVDGGAGNDRLEVQRAGSVIPLVLDGLFEVTFRGGTGNDTLIGDFSTTNSGTQFATFSDDSKMRGLRLILDGGLGNDTISATVANNNTATFVYDLALLGGLGNDTLTFAAANNGGTPTYGPANGALVDGGAGLDTVTTTPFGGFVIKKYV